MDEEDEKLFSGLESMDFLLLLPTAVLWIVVNYTKSLRVVGILQEVIEMSQPLGYPTTLTCYQDDLCVITGRNHNNICFFGLKEREWREQVINVSLQFPYGSAFDPVRKEWIITDRGNYRLVFLDMERKAIRFVDKQTFGCLINALQISIDVVGRLLFILEVYSGCIFIYHLDLHESVGRLDIGKTQGAMGLTYDSSRKWIWVAISATNKVVAYDVTSGEIRKELTHPELYRPYGLNLSWSDHEILVVDHTSVKVFSVNSGDYLFKFGDDVLSEPVAIALDHTRGLVYVLDHDTSRIYAFR